jgi:hypothetical protein
MKKTIYLLLTFAVIGCSADDTAKTVNTSYITDNDFTIEVVSYETWGDITNDGITQNVLIESGTGGSLKFVKATGETKASDVGSEFANSSENGILIFNNYWKVTPKIVDFTEANKFTIKYDSRKDEAGVSYEISTTTAYYK